MCIEIDTILPIYQKKKTLKVFTTHIYVPKRRGCGPAIVKTYRKKKNKNVSFDYYLLLALNHNNNNVVSVAYVVFFFFLVDWRADA